MKLTAATLPSAGLSLLSLLLLPQLCAAAKLACQSRLPPRPSPVASPYAPALPHHESPARNGQVCYVRALGGGRDDATTLFSALKACNNGGTVYMPDPLYNIKTALDLTFLSRVDVVISGTVLFGTDFAYWTGASFQYQFQNTSLLWQWGGFDVNMYGGGTIDGNGQAWWDYLLVNTTVQRPVMTGLINLTSSTISHLHERNPPNWFNFISGGKDILISDMNFTVVQTGDGPADNTDGWDTYRSDSVVIQNSHVQNTDDCVSFKPNSTNIVVQNMVCNGSHGISVGSLGQYVGEVDIVENIMAYNNTMLNCGSSARIKVFQNAIPNPDGSIPYGEGGGNGVVRNITYNTMRNTNDDYVIQITQCYGTNNLTACALYPSLMIIEDVLFENFTGTSSTHYEPIVGTLVCSSESVCPNIVAKNISISPPDGAVAQWTCTNMDNALLDINCV